MEGVGQSAIKVLLPYYLFATLHEKCENEDKVST